MDFSNISILNLMPTNLAADKNIKMMAEAFDEVLRDIIKKIPDVEMIPNLTLNQIVNETLIDLLAWQFHVDFYEPGLPVEIKRELVLKSLDWHYRKGTPSVVEEIVSTVFSKAKIQEWYEYGGRPYRFRIATEERISDVEAVKKLMRAVNSVKNTRSFLDNLTHLANFIDKVIMEDLANLAIRPEVYDLFNTQLLYNGAINYDGETINDTISVDSGYDGMSEYDGQLEYDGTKEIVPNYKLRTDFTYSSSTLDFVGIAVRFSGFEDTVPADDSLVVAVKLNLLDTVETEPDDSLEMTVRYSGFEDAVTAGDSPALAVKNDTEDTVEMSDGFSVGIRYEHEYDGSCGYDGSMDFNSMELEALGG